MTASAAVDRMLFVYGTLMIPDILGELLDYAPRSLPWSVHGWRRVRLKDRTFPGLIPGSSSETTSGLVLLGLSADDWALIRDYEGPMYECRSVGTGPADEQVVTYVCVDYALTEGQPLWHPERFSLEDITRYRGRLRAWKLERA